jgi:hypothetical protein
MYSMMISTYLSGAEHTYSMIISTYLTGTDHPHSMMISTYLTGTEHPHSMMIMFGLGYWSVINLDSDGPGSTPETRTNMRHRFRS